LPSHSRSGAPAITTPQGVRSDTALPAGHPDIALSLNNLAALYRRQGRLRAAFFE